MKKIIFIAVFFICLNSFSQKKYPHLVFETNEGTIVLLLYDETSFHSENFVKLVNEGYYNGQIFHRVIKNFMIQAGDPNSKNATSKQVLGNGGPGYTLPPEFVKKYYHKKGALAAARLGDNINPDKYSSGSQFYIVVGQLFTISQLNQMVSQGKHIPFTPEQIISYTTLGGAPHLDYQYTVFGEVISGLDVVEKISKTAVDQNSRPIKDIIINKAYTKK
jgi:cyclophilin family peptidyl-prolyl cis-trans isomerase